MVHGLHGYIDWSVIPDDLREDDRENHWAVKIKMSAYSPVISANYSFMNSKCVFPAKYVVVLSVIINTLKSKVV